jgi:metal-dependent HD superfamily phosphatase/phosphodiesterase
MSNEILNIKDHHERLWGAVAYTKTKLRTLVKKPIDEWPAELRPFAGMIVKDGKLAIDEKMLMIHDIAAYDVDLDPNMRRAIAMEIVKWVQPQARSISAVLNESTGRFATPVHMLQPLTTETKRHLQLTGNVVSVAYNAENNQSTVKIPYLVNAIVVKNQDLSKVAFDNVVLKPSATNPNVWQLTAKEGTGRYQIDLIDAVYRPKRRTKPVANKSVTSNKR